MAQSMGYHDSSEMWYDSTTGALKGVLSCNPKQMMDLLKSVFISTADEKSIRAAIAQYGGGMQSWKKIRVMAPCPTVNATSATCTRQLIQTFNPIVKAPGAVPVAIAGTYVIIDKPYCGISVRVHGEIPLGITIPLPGAAPVSNTNIPNAPLLPTQIPFGPSIASKIGNFGSCLGAPSVGNYSIPSWMTPPVGVNDSLPPYSSAQWTNSNGFLFNPGSWTPYISSSSAQAGTFNAIMLLRNAKEQIQNSEQLPASYSSGRRIASYSDLYLTANASGTTASGIGAVCFATFSDIPNWGPAVITTQGGKNSLCGVTLVRGRPEDQQGIRTIQGTNVNQIMGPLEYSLVSGGLGSRNFQIFSTLIPASAMFNVPVITNPPVSGPNALSVTGGADVLTNSNYVNDRAYSGYGQILWVSDKTTNVGGSYCQARQMPTTDIQIAGLGVGEEPVNNIYGKVNTPSFPTTWNTDSAGVTFQDITNVQIPMTNEDAPPNFKLHFAAIGGTNAGSLGNGCHVWAQIMADDTVVHQMQPFGLGIWGLSGAGSGSNFYAPYGVSPGVSYVAETRDIHVPVQPGPFQFTRQWTWIGMFVCINAMPNAQLQVEMNLEIPLENTPNITGPLFVTRIDGASPQQQIIYTMSSVWELVAFASTRAVDNKSGGVLRPMIDSRFPDLLRDLFASENADFFKVVFDVSSWAQRVNVIMTKLDTTKDFVDLLINQDFVRIPDHSLHDHMRLVVTDRDTEQDERISKLEDRILDANEKDSGAEARSLFGSLTDHVEKAIAMAKHAASVAQQGLNAAQSVQKAYQQFKGNGGGGGQQRRKRNRADAQMGAGGDAQMGAGGDAQMGAGGSLGELECDSDPDSAEEVYDRCMNTQNEYYAPSRAVKADAFFNINDKWYLTSGSPNSTDGLSYENAPWMSPLYELLGLPFELRTSEYENITAWKMFQKENILSKNPIFYFKMSLSDFVNAVSEINDIGADLISKTNEELIAVIKSSKRVDTLMAKMLLMIASTQKNRSHFLSNEDNGTRIIDQLNMVLAPAVIAAKSWLSELVGGGYKSDGSAVMLQQKHNISIAHIHSKSGLKRRDGLPVISVVDNQIQLTTTFPTDYFLMCGVDANRSVILPTRYGNKLLKLAKHKSIVASMEARGINEKRMNEWITKHPAPSPLSFGDQKAFLTDAKNAWSLTLHNTKKIMAEGAVVLYIVEMTSSVFRYQRRKDSRENPALLMSKINTTFKAVDERKLQALRSEAKLYQGYSKKEMEEADLTEYDAPRATSEVYANLPEWSQQKRPADFARKGDIRLKGEPKKQEPQ